MVNDIENIRIRLRKISVSYSLFRPTRGAPDAVRTEGIRTDARRSKRCIRPANQVLPSLFTANGRESWLLGSAGCVELLLNSRAGHPSHPVIARDWILLGHTIP